MNSEETSRPLGNLPPGGIPHKCDKTDDADSQPATQESVSHSNQATAGHRGPAEILVPRPKGIPTRPLDKNDLPDEEIESKDATAVNPGSSIGSFGITVVLGIGAIVACFLLILVSQFVSLISQLGQLPAFVSIPGSVLVTLLLGVVLAFAIRLLWLWLRLQQSPGISLSILRATNRQCRTKGNAAECERARRTLESYLKTYDCESDTAIARLKWCGADDATVSKLRAEKQALLDKTIGRGANDWLRRFDEKFLAPLDEVARARCKTLAIVTGAKTASSPNAAIDTIIVGYMTLYVIGDLCTLYNLRVGRSGTFVLMLRAFANTFLASHLEEVGESVADSISDGIGNTLGTVATVLAAKFGEGLANGILLYRLGNSAIQHVRPLRP